MLLTKTKTSRRENKKASHRTHMLHKNDETHQTMPLCKVQRAGTQSRYRNWESRYTHTHREEENRYTKQLQNSTERRYRKLVHKAGPKMQNFRILICFKWWSVCVCVHACVHVHAWMHACSEHYSCVCGCMSVEEAGAGEWGENVRVRFLGIYFIFIVILNVPSWAHVSKENFHFYALYVDK